eukprot:gene16504-19619_t
MNTQEVADRLVQLCREGKNVDAINELYDEHIVSREPAGTPMEITEGKEAVRDKTIQWINSVEQVHHESFSDAMVGGDFFSCVMEIDVTYKQHGRMAMTEIAVYEVKNGKIIAEQFFYRMPA